MIECTLKPLKTSLYFSDLEEKKTPKYGQYSHSVFHDVSGFGTKRWVVIVNIELDYELYSKQFTDEEIVNKCINYLNTPKPSKYGKKRKRKLPFGLFEQVYRFSIKEDLGKKYIQARLIVQQRKNKQFRGEGEKFSHVKRR